MLNKEVPFVRIVVPLAVGVICGLWIDPGKHLFSLLLPVVSISLLLTLVLGDKLSKIVYGLSFTLAMWTIGLYLYSLEKEAITELELEEAIFIGEIDDYPTEKANTFQIIIKLAGKIGENTNSQPEGYISVYHDKEYLPGNLLPGDIVAFTLTPVDISNRGNPEEFDYKSYMERKRIKYIGFTGENDLVPLGAPKRRKIVHTALIVRQRLLDMYSERGIENNRLALIAAITLGDKRLLDPDQKEIFSRAGIMHIMAVSGLHVGIVSMLVMSLLFFLKGRFRPLRIIIAILSLWVFAFITGVAPSVVRASLMFTFLHAGRLLKRPVNHINSLLASAFILIILRPSVIFDTGFQLSYLAVFFILKFYGHLSGLFYFNNRIADFVWKSASIAFIAQAGTLPLTIALFNRFPTWFMLSNVLILPIATATLITGLLTLITYPVPFLSVYLGKILDSLLWLTEFMTGKAASLPMSTIDGIGMSTFECILLIITITLSFRYLIDRKRLSPILPLTAVLLFTATGTVSRIESSKKNEFIVYNTIGYSTVAVRSGRTLSIISDSLEIPEVTRHSATLHLKPVVTQSGETPLLINGNQKKILLTHFIEKSMLDSISPDIIVLKGKTCHIENNINLDRTLKAIIISDEVRLDWEQRQTISGIGADSLHFVDSRGAYITGL